MNYQIQLAAHNLVSLLEDSTHLCSIDRAVYESCNDLIRALGGTKMVGNLVGTRAEAETSGEIAIYILALLLRSNDV
jgi:hypothetical protein